jgi:hypothetical protein
LLEDACRFTPSGISVPPTGTRSRRVGNNLPSNLLWTVQFLRIPRETLHRWNGRRSCRQQICSHFTGSGSSIARLRQVSRRFPRFCRRSAFGRVRGTRFAPPKAMLTSPDPRSHSNVMARVPAVLPTRASRAMAGRLLYLQSHASCQRIVNCASWSRPNIEAPRGHDRSRFSMMSSSPPSACPRLGESRAKSEAN